MVEQQSAPRTSPLVEAQRRGDATFAEAGGWLTVAHYGDVAAEYEAVRGAGGGGLIDLSARGRVEVSGGEAGQFLNGLVTNDVKTLAEGAWMAAAFPNPQGRLLAFARVARLGGAFLIDTEPETRGRVHTALERFTLAGDFSVRDLTEECAHLSLQGARAGKIIEELLGVDAAFLPANGALKTEWRGSPLTLLRATHTAEDGFDLFVGAARAEELWESLAGAGVKTFGADALEILRVEAGVPRHGLDVTETNVVLEAGRDEAVSFTKGCYVGQEIIARIHFRGHVAKRLAGLTLEGAEPPPRGAKIFNPDVGREVGRVTSAVFSPRLGHAVALGIVKYDFLKPGTELFVVSGDAGEGGGEARAAAVTELPFVRGSWYARGGASAEETDGGDGA